MWCDLTSFHRRFDLTAKFFTFFLNKTSWTAVMRSGSDVGLIWMWSIYIWSARGFVLAWNKRLHNKDIENLHDALRMKHDWQKIHHSPIGIYSDRVLFSRRTSPQKDHLHEQSLLPRKDLCSKETFYPRAIFWHRWTFAQTRSLCKKGILFSRRAFCSRRTVSPEPQEGIPDQAASSVPAKTPSKEERLSQEGL